MLFFGLMKRKSQSTIRIIVAKEEQRILSITEKNSLKVNSSIMKYKK